VILNFFNWMEVKRELARQLPYVALIREQ